MTKIDIKDYVKLTPVGSAAVIAEALIAARSFVEDDDTTDEIASEMIADLEKRGYGIVNLWPVRDTIEEMDAATAAVFSSPA